MSRPADHDVHEEPRAVGRDRDVGPRLRVGVLGPDDGIVLPPRAEHVVVDGAVVLVARRVAGVGEARAVGLPRHAARPGRRDGLAAVGAVGGVEHPEDGVLAAGLARADGDERAVGRRVEPVDGVGRVGGADGRVEQDDGRGRGVDGRAAGQQELLGAGRVVRGRRGDARGPARPRRRAAASTRRGARATSPDRGGRRAPGGCVRSGRRPTAGPRQRRRPRASGTGRGPRRRGGSRRRPHAAPAGAASSTCWFGQPRPMLGRLPWLALERRSRDLRFFVFFDIGERVYGRARPVPPADRPQCGGQFGSADSMAATRVGSSGVDHRAEPGDRAVRRQRGTSRSSSARRRRDPRRRRPGSARRRSGAAPGR